MAEFTSDCDAKVKEPPDDGEPPPLKVNEAPPISKRRLPFTVLTDCALHCKNNRHPNATTMFAIEGVASKSYLITVRNYFVAMAMEDSELQTLYVWLDEIPLSRPKKSITRDFSDGGLSKSLHLTPSSCR
jgi:hypothetical protein